MIYEVSTFFLSINHETSSSWFIISKFKTFQYGCLLIFIDQCLLWFLQGIVLLEVALGPIPFSHLYLRELLRFLPRPEFLQLLIFKGRSEDGFLGLVVVEDCDMGFRGEMFMCLFYVLFPVI